MTPAGATQVEAPSPAVAPPPGHPRFELFDSLRAVGVVGVLTFHVCSVTRALEQPVAGDVVAIYGSRAVLLFFVISAFLLYRPFVAARAEGRPAPRTRKFFRRRALRIFPGYWVALTLLAIFPGVVGVFSEDWWRYYFFLQLYDHETLGGGIAVAWTLCVEAAFYLALPLWALGVARLQRDPGRRAWLRAELAPLALAAAVGVAIQVAAARGAVSHLVGQSILGQAPWLALGMALAVASVAVEGSRREHPRLVRAAIKYPGLCWIGAAACFAGLTVLLKPGGLVGIIAALASERPVAETLAGIALSALLCTLFVLPAVFGEREGGFPRRVLALRPLAWIGLISYGIYLWHLPVAQLLGLPAGPGSFEADGLDLVGKIDFAVTPILLALTLAVTVAIAALSYYLVELPFLRRKER